MDRFPCAGGYEYNCCVINGRNEDLFPSANSTNFGEFKMFDAKYVFSIIVLVYEHNENVRCNEIVL